MAKYLVFLFQLIVLSIYSQANLVLNGSLELGEEAVPFGWTIEAKTVDLYYKNSRVGDKPVTRFPLKGSHGLRYFGVYSNEVISCSLTNKLSEDSDYRISFSVRNPPIYNNKSTNKFTVKAYEKTGKEKIIVLETEEIIDTTMQKWTKVSQIIKGFDSTDKIHFGFFGDSYNDLEHQALGLYYLFDDVSIVKGVTNNDTLTYHFEQGSSELSDSQIASLEKLKDYTNRIVNSIIINGYASQIGEDKDNMELSKFRTSHIRALLYTWSPSIVLNHYGESQSTVGNESIDRKVEVIINFTSF